MLSWVSEYVAARLPVSENIVVSAVRTITPRTVRGTIARAASASAVATTLAEPEGVELAYETADWAPAKGGRLTNAIYEEYGLQAIRIPGAQVHPTKLV